MCVGGGQLRKTACALAAPGPCHSAGAVREETKQNREVEVDSIISAVSSLFIQDLQRSISLLLS